jgi:ribonuclease P protein component
MRLGREFETAVRRGRRSGRRTVVVHAMRTGERGDTARVGFVVSKSVGTAVVRNRVKRRLRAAMASRVGALPPDALVVVRANPAAATVGSEELRADLDVALPRAVADATRAASARPAGVLVEDGSGR